jgi:hemerythrin
MIDIDYPEVALHTSLHREVRERLVELQKNFPDYPIEKVNKEVLDLMDGYVRHIRDHDMRIKEYWIDQKGKQS